MQFLRTRPQSPRAEFATQCATAWFTLTPALMTQWFTADALYENRLSNRTIATGPDEILQTLVEYGNRVERCEGTLLNIAESGDVVLLERDEMTYLKNGKSTLVPVMDSFQFREGKIFAWREYWDLATLTDHIGDDF